MSYVASEVYQNKWLDALLGDGRAASMPATVYAVLYTGEVSNGGTELGADGGYAAVTLANSSSNFPNATAGGKSSVVISWTFTGAASDVATWGYLSDGTDLIIGGPLSSACVIGAAGGTFTDSLAMSFPDTP